jgi:hypothetical protein
MTTPLMWETLKRGQNLSENLLPLRLRWDSVVRRIQFDSMGKWQLLWLVEVIILFPILGVGSFLMDATFLLSSSTDNPLRKEIMDSDQAIITRLILSLVYFGGCTFIIGIILWGEQIAMLFNELLQFDENMKKRQFSL